VTQLDLKQLGTDRVARKTDSGFYQASSQLDKGADFVRTWPPAVCWIVWADGPVPERVRPMNVSLTNDLRDFVRQKVTSGEFPSEEAVLQEAVRRFRQEDLNRCRADDAGKGALEDLIDYEAIAYCAREVEGKDVPSIEEVRRMLSKIPGSMGQAVVEERQNRF
jgi:Arc/MetJ-type ribon-helix-helix transcriptional regulator